MLRMPAPTATLTREAVAADAEAPAAAPLSCTGAAAVLRSARGCITAAGRHVRACCCLAGRRQGATPQRVPPKLAAAAVGSAGARDARIGAGRVCRSGLGRPWARFDSTRSHTAGTACNLVMMPARTFIPHLPPTIGADHTHLRGSTGIAWHTGARLTACRHHELHGMRRAVTT